MIVNLDGEIVSKANEFNKRHSWERWSPNQWLCRKCDCVKTQVEPKYSNYTLYGVVTENAPECDNSKLSIIKNSKKDERERIKRQQLCLF